MASTNRRQFIQAGMAGAGLAVAGLPARPAAATPNGSALDILVLGGTGFIGPHMVREALRRGHRVTLFNRGRTNNALFPDLETIRGDRNNGLDGLRNRRWDAVVDNSGYVPRHVRDSARLLAPNVGRYLFISTVSVYADFTISNAESSPLAAIDDESIEQVTGETYGPLKALCEQRVRTEVDDERLTILRPTYICGPGDHTDRFSWWPVRTRRGGDMLWPGKPSDAIQIVDVRDLANFTIDCLDNPVTGTFNAASAAGGYTMGDLLDDCRAIAAADVTPHWIGEQFAYEAGLIGGRELPIWHPSGGEHGAGGSFANDAAVAAGLHIRPPRETARDLLTWWDTLSEERRGQLRAGIAAEREQQLIETWKRGTS